MKHLGDISKISGADIPPVDIITFGSPCQDLSVAGKRAGLKHTDNGDEETTRSGLFMEAVRIIREMREATNGEYPTFALWENVPGAFSSNKGEDFRVVLEELIKIVEPGAEVPPMPKGGWPYADAYVGDGWSLAYRTFDAQYWGVPQRRRRIHLVLDLRGERAGRILFEREGLRGYFAEGGTPRKSAAGDAESCAGAADREGECVTFEPGIARREGGHIYEGVSGTLRANAGDNQIAVAYTLKIRSGCEGGGKGALWQEDVSATLATNNDQYLFQPVDMVLDDQGGQQISVRTDGKSPTLRAEMHGNVPCVLEAAGFKAGQGPKARSIGWETEKCPTLASEAGGNSVPSVCVKCWDARGNGDGETVSTLTGDHENRVTDYTSLVVEESHVYSIQGNTIDRNAKQNGSGISEDVSHTLNAVDRHGVVYCMAHGQANAEICENKSPCLNCNHEQPIVVGSYQNTGVGWWNESPVGATLRTPCGGDATMANVVVEGECAGVDCRNTTEYPELSGTLQAKSNGGFSLNCNQVVRVRYIVRRLTPTECARLQGFADKWGEIDFKDDFTDREYIFWLGVRNTHAAINGKEMKAYSKEQMLKWYNKLHTDSAEYRMWGNGIALPPALYVMQGIAEELAGKGSAQ